MNAFDVPSMYKELLAGVAIVLTFAAYAPYIRSIRAGRTKPHVFSWITWTLSAFVVCAAQLADRGGAGAWATGASGLITAYVAFLAFRARGSATNARIDWLFLSIAVAALPCWLLTSDPLLAVALLTAIELAGFGPTFRSAFNRPQRERISFYALGVVRNALVVAALEHYSLITVLFPAAKGVVCALLIAMIGYRRTRVRHHDVRGQART